MDDGIFTDHRSHLSELQWTIWWEDTRGIICWNEEEGISMKKLNEKEKEIGNGKAGMVN